TNIIILLLVVAIGREHVSLQAFVHFHSALLYLHRVLVNAIRTHQLPGRFFHHGITVLVVSGFAQFNCALTTIIIIIVIICLFAILLVYLCKLRASLSNDSPYWLSAWN